MADLLKWAKPKDPSEVLDYAFDFTKLLAPNEVLEGVSWTVPTGIEKQYEGMAPNASNVEDTVAVVWVSGGTDRNAYVLTCTAQTTGGRTFERSGRLLVANK